MQIKYSNKFVINILKIFSLFLVFIIIPIPNSPFAQDILTTEIAKDDFLPLWPGNYFEYEYSRHYSGRTSTNSWIRKITSQHSIIYKYNFLSYDKILNQHIVLMSRTGLYSYSRRENYGSMAINYSKTDTINDESIIYFMEKGGVYKIEGNDTIFFGKHFYSNNEFVKTEIEKNVYEIENDIKKLSMFLSGKEYDKTK